MSLLIIIIHIHMTISEILHINISNLSIIHFRMAFPYFIHIHIIISKTLNKHDLTIFFILYDHILHGYYSNNYCRHHAYS